MSPYHVKNNDFFTLSQEDMYLDVQRVPGGQGVGLQGPLGSRVRPTGDRVLGRQGVGLQCPKGSRGRLTGSQEGKGYA